MFEIDVAGLAELEGGKPPQRLAFEPVANVFDEYRGYQEGRKRPSFCAVTLKHSANPRGVVLTVADDGAGFANAKDIWTLFGSTAKRSAAGVSGRFNFGEKQLIALAREATIKTNNITVQFAEGKRDVKNHRHNVVSGTIVEALMPWSLKDLEEVRAQLRAVLPPAGLAYTVDGQAVERPAPRCTVSISLPTVILTDGVMRDSIRKSLVAVLKETTPRVYELGLPVSELSELGFPWSLDVEQKIPLPVSRDTVTPKYLFRLIGGAIEQAALDSVTLLTEEEQGAGFVKGALDWVREAAALKATVASLFGANAVRQSNDAIANAQATASGATLISGRWFGADTRRRLDECKAIPTAKDVFGGTESLPKSSGETCPRCGGKGTV